MKRKDIIFWVVIVIAICSFLGSYILLNPSAPEMEIINNTKYNTWIDIHVDGEYHGDIEALSGETTAYKLDGLTKGRTYLYRIKFSWKYPPLEIKTDKNIKLIINSDNFEIYEIDS